MSDDKKILELELKFPAKKDYSEILLKEGFVETKQKHQVDTYYIFDKMIKGFKHWLRLREDKLSKTSSLDWHRQITSYATDEIEAGVDYADISNMKNIIEFLGQEEKCIIDKKRRCYKKDDMEITLDEVKDLGSFIEIEILGYNNEENISKIEKMVEKQGLDMKDNSKKGYPELFFEKNR